MKRHSPEEPRESHPLFDPPRARQSDPRTSKAAAESITERSAESIRARVLGTLRMYGGCTDEDLVAKFAALNLPGTPSGIRTRRAELTDAGLVVDSGETRELASGRAGIVWRAK